jgi:hypothetical protein
MHKQKKMVEHMNCTVFPFLLPVLHDIKIFKKTSFNQKIQLLLGYGLAEQVCSCAATFLRPTDTFESLRLLTENSVT